MRTSADVMDRNMPTCSKPKTISVRYVKGNSYNKILNEFFNKSPNTEDMFEIVRRLKHD